MEILLKLSIKHNPFFAEPYVILSQLKYRQGEFSQAKKNASQGLKLMFAWGTAWDKRM